MFLVDESRLTYGADAAVALLAGDAPVVGPATFLERAIALRVISDGERRAIVRRIAATRPELKIPEHVRRSPSFARLVLSAIDRGDETTFAELAGEYRTLLAFANAVDTSEALQRALAVGTVSAGITELRIDAALLGGEHAFGWRRLAALGNFTLAALELEPPAAPALDRVGITSAIAFLRFAQSESDTDARSALRSKLAPIDPADARLLLATAGDAANVLDVIDAGAAGGGREFAHALRSIARAYRLPDAGATDVVDALAGILGLDPVTHAALARIALDFDRARLLAPAWEAVDIIDEFEAELAGVVAPAAVATIPAPAPALAPEAAAPFETRRRTFSASSLNTYAECARKWYFRYVCAAVEDRGSSASFYGTAFHAALEEFHGTHTRFDHAAAPALESFLDYCIVVAFDRHRTRFDAAVEFELQKRRARRTGKRYVAWLIERARRAPFEVIGCETETDVELDGMPFIGFIDRLDRDDATGEVTVVDYKTGSIASSGSEYLTDVLDFREFQLPFYYWARTAAGDRVTRLALVPLKDALLDVEPIELLVAPRRPRTTSRGTSATIGVDDLERARERMVEIARTLSSPVTAHFPATDDPDACRYCAYRASCRERPVVAEERFGR
jgi:RecB family exonuclease